MRRYSFVIFICILITAIFLIYYQEVQFKEEESVLIQAEYKIDSIDKKPNYTMFYSSNIAIIEYDYSLSEERKIEPGTIVSVQGNLFNLNAYEQRSYANYLKSRDYDYLLKSSEIVLVKQGINLKTIIYRIRENIGRRVDFIYRADSPFVKALVYGDKSEIEENDTDMFSKTGISHLLAISGFHIGLLASIVLILLKNFPSSIKYFLVLIFIFVYVVITGARPSAIRAGIFYLIYIISIFYCRRYDIISSAFLLSSLLIILNPYILYDAGFTLSFMAVISIGMFYKSISSLLKKIKFLPSYLLSLMSLTIAAQILTLPLTYFYFQRISFISILSNLVSVPLVTMIYPFMLFSLVIYKIPILGSIMINIVKLLKFILYYFNQKISEFSMAYIDFDASNIYTTIVAYVLIFIFYTIFTIYTLKENKNELQGFTQKY